MNSFSSEVKKELSQINNLSKKELVRAELFGYLITSSSNSFTTQSEYNINRFSKLLRNMEINDFKIEIQGKVYIITIKNKQYENLISENLFEQNDFWQKEELVRSFSRGLFLGSGSINNPNNKYHLEIKIPNNELISKIIEILKKYNINIKTIDGSIYIKDGEEISKFLAFIGAGKSVLKFEEIRVQRYMNNKVNRIVNCQTANLNKTINASVEQINAIKKLKETGRFNKIDKSLQELAELRLEHPDMPLSELGKLLKEPIGKSGVNYRMKKIIELSK